MSVDPLPSDHIKVEVAFTTAPDDVAPVWVDITPWVDLNGGANITFGRGDEYAIVQTGTASVALVNSDGRFSPGNVTSPYYPNVKIRKKLRISYANPTGGDRSYRFTGYIEEWPTEWPTGGDVYSSSQVTAVDRFKRLGVAAQMRSTIEQEYLANSPTSSYVLDELEGSTTAGDTSGMGRDPLTTAQRGTGGELNFGVAVAPGVEPLAAPEFVPDDVSNGKYLQMLTGEPLASSVALTVEAFVNTAVAEDQTIVRLYGGASWVEIATTAAGKAYAAHYDAESGTTFFALTSPASIDDGLFHHVAITCAWYLAAHDTFTVRADLVVDGVSVANNPSYDVVGPISFDTMRVGGHSGGKVFDGVISNVATYSAGLSVADLASHHDAAADGFVGERSDQRIARIARYAGVVTGEQALEVGSSTSISAAVIDGQSPLTAMQDIATTENGVLFIDNEGLLTFHSRSHRYNAASVFTVTAADIAPTARFITNDALMINTATASRPNGIIYRAVNIESVTDYGVTAVDITLLTTSDLEVMDAAHWRANQTAIINPRLPNLSVDLMTSPLLTETAVLLTIGSRITLAGLPAQAPASSVDLFVEGWTETITTDGWVLTLNTSPAPTSAVWVLDSALYSQLDQTTILAY